MFGQRDSSTTQNASDPMGAPTLPTSDATASTTSTTPAPTEPAASTFSSSILDSPAAATPPTPSVTAPMPTASATTTDPATTDDLIRMKQEALQHLQPLVGSLQQAPEEEFRTLMMMIQATDDRTLLKKALDSAKSIKDDKIRAQAMLDVINEINYFTQTSQE
jgi:hypothetical protein